MLKYMFDIDDLKQAYNLTEINSATFYCPYMNNTVLHEITNNRSLKNMSNITFIINNDINNFLCGKSNFSTLEVLQNHMNVTIKTTTNLNYFHLVLNKEFFFLGYPSGNPIDNVHFDHSPPSLITNSILIHNLNNHYNVSNDLSDNYNNLVLNYINHVKQWDDETIYSFHKLNSSYYLIGPKLIPQYSKLSDATTKLIDVLHNCGDYGVVFNKLGFYLTQPGKKETAYKKYGENHSKFAETLDLVKISSDRIREVSLTQLGRMYHELDYNDSNKLLFFQILRSPVIKDIIDKSQSDEFNIITYLNAYLSDSTARRRSSNIKNIFNYLSNSSLPQIQNILSKF